MWIVSLQTDATEAKACESCESSATMGLDVGFVLFVLRVPYIFMRMQSSTRALLKVYYRSNSTNLTCEYVAILHLIDQICSNIVRQYLLS